MLCVCVELCVCVFVCVCVLNGLCSSYCLILAVFQVSVTNSIQEPLPMEAIGMVTDNYKCMGIARISV